MESDTPLASTSKILIYRVEPISSDQVHPFIDQIRTYKRPSFSSSIATPTSSTSTSGSTASTNDLQWTIDNKYYTCPVEFKPVEFVSDISGEEPAIIVLASSLNKAPDEKLVTVLKSISARNEGEGFEIALLYILERPPSNRLNSEFEDEIEEDSYDDLAIEHQFEYVPSFKGGEIEEVGKFEQAERGIGRIVSALHSHLWEGMIPKSQSTTTPRANRAPRSIIDVDEEENQDELREPALPKAKEFVPVKMEFPTTFLPLLNRRDNDKEPNRFEDDFSPFVETRNEFDDQEIENGPKGEGYRHPGFSFPEHSESSFLDVEERERDGGGGADHQEDEDLEKLFEKLSTARSEAMGMDMEQRRAFAEKMVLSMLGDGPDDDPE